MWGTQPETAAAKTVDSPASRSLSQYHILWNGVPAGKACLEFATLGDQHLVLLKGETDVIFKAVYPMKIVAESRLLSEGAVPLQYQEKTQEGRKKEKTERLLFATNGDTVDVFKNGKFRRTLLVSPGTMDPLGGLYRFLGAATRGPASHLMRITDGTRVFEVRMIPAERQTMETPLGTKAAQEWRATIQVISGKPHPLEKSTLRVWTLEDTPAILLKAHVKLPYGEFSTFLQGVPES